MEVSYRSLLLILYVGRMWWLYRYDTPCLWTYSRLMAKTRRVWP